MRIRAVFVAVAIAVTLASVSSAYAEQPPPTPTPTRPEWAGGPILLSDLASAAIFFSGLARSSRPQWGSGIALYALGGPAVHIARKEGDRFWLSLGARIGFPVLLGGPLLLLNIGHCDRGTDLASGIGHGVCEGKHTLIRDISYTLAVAGALGASILDVAELSTHHVARKPESAVQRTPVVASFAPSVDLGKDHATLGLRATF